MIERPVASEYLWGVVEGWELGPFEGPPNLMPPALPGDTYYNALFAEEIPCFPTDRGQFNLLSDHTTAELNRSRWL